MATAFSRLSDNINVEWLRKKCSISIRSEQQGYKFALEDYFFDIRVGAVNEKIVIDAQCHRSQRKNERPHKISAAVSGESLNDALCSCTAG